MNQPLLSVIVPCYNVEKFMDKCISSIVNQTYTNLEILLIDDGSTDATGAICDTWKEKDKRIRVVHKPNKGVAHTRKTGIEHATAEYVAFVDADDWIALNMYADLMSALLSTNSDIAQCAFCYVNENGEMTDRVLSGHHEPVEIFNRIEGTLLILQEYRWTTSLAAKIYKKDLFRNVEFPIGRGYGEDIIVLYLFHHALQSVLLNRGYYFYFQRNDSISRKGDIQKEMKKMSDCSDANYERYSFVSRFPEYSVAMPYIEYLTACYGMYLLRNITAYPQYFTREYFDVKAKEMSSISFAKKENLPRSVKVEWNILKISPKLYKFFRWFYVRAVRVTNRLKITNRQICYSLPDIYWVWFNPSTYFSK